MKNIIFISESFIYKFKISYTLIESYTLIKSYTITISIKTRQKNQFLKKKPFAKTNKIIFLLF